MRTAEQTMGTTLPPLHDLYTMRCTNRARRIIKDPHHPLQRTVCDPQLWLLMLACKTTSVQLMKQFILFDDFIEVVDDLRASIFFCLNQMTNCIAILHKRICHSARGRVISFWLHLLYINAFDNN